jgi:hypothetical protein
MCLSQTGKHYKYVKGFWALVLILCRKRTCRRHVPTEEKLDEISCRMEMSPRILLVWLAYQMYVCASSAWIATKWIFTGMFGICWELYNHKVGGRLKKFVEFCRMEETELPIKARMCTLRRKTVCYLRTGWEILVCYSCLCSANVSVWTVGACQVLLQTSHISSGNLC